MRYMKTKTIRLHDRITVSPEICHGKPCIEGTRVMISIIVDWLAAEATFDEIIDAYPSITREDIKSVLEYTKALIKNQQLADKEQIEA